MIIGQNAFPFVPTHDTQEKVYGGLTNRDVFALAALVGMLMTEYDPNAPKYAYFAKRSYKYADTMLEEKAK